MKLKVIAVLLIATNIVAAPTHPPGVTLIHYVSPDGAHVAPFTTWVNAANDIQSAVDVSDDGDVVMVGDGIYDEGAVVVSNLPCRVSLTNSIIVQSVNGPESTLIVGEGPIGPNAVRCAFLSYGAQLRGFTLTNGHTHATAADEWDSMGGGALLNGGRIENCIVTSNSAYQAGGIQVYLDGVVSNCIVRSNVAVFTAGGVRLHKGGRFDDCIIILNFADYGGGVDINEIGSFNNCVISSNSAGVRGGGAWCYKGGNLTNCIITANSAVYGGGGVSCYQAGTLVGCTISSNINSSVTSAYGGGGVYFNQGGTLENCVISGNSANNGGGIDCYVSGEFNSCTISGNSAMTSGGGARFSSGGALTNCIASGNTAPGQGNDFLYDPVAIMYSSCSPDLIHGVDGNITNAPLFVNPGSGDYRLLATSPCIDSGDNDAVFTETDLDGNPRIVDGDLDGTAIVDMGAYEFNVQEIPVEIMVLTINLKSKGRTPVSIITTEDFDATTIDPSTVRFAGASPVKYSLSDVDGDGDIDLKLHFMTQDLVLDPADGEVTLMGQTYDGVLVVGMDTVKVVPRK